MSARILSDGHGVALLVDETGQVIGCGELLPSGAWRWEIDRAGRRHVLVTPAAAAAA